MNIEKTGNGFDKPNAIIAALVSLISLIVYFITVQPTLSYWDCGEFIACSYIMGIPHPPGSPLFIAFGRIFSLIPFAADICYRINLLSVISSSATVLFGYLSLVRIIKYWFIGSDFSGWKRIITYIGGASGALFMAFASTYWANAVEAEVYGLSMMFMTMILWMMLVYYDVQGTPKGSKIIVICCFMAVLGVGIHLSTFLIMPVAAIFFILKKGTPSKAYIYLCVFFVAELVGILLFADGRGGYDAFIFASVLLLLGVALLVYKYINWPVLIAIGSFSLIMVGYYQFVYGVIAGVIILLIMSKAAPYSDWKTGLAIIVVAVLGFSIHLLIPIRSAQDPRIDENNADREFSLVSLVSYQHRTPFINYLERKQYGSQSMVERMFVRRGTLAHQFGRHAHMGFWSYFEKQYGLTPIFFFVFLLGLFGAFFATYRKTEIGLPFLILLLLSSVGLILYMNFADGIKYNPQTGDAYLEVRNRDYFFTPAYAYFGLALGLGIAGLMEVVRRLTSSGAMAGFQKPILAVMSLLVLLPGVALTDNFYENDRSNNYYPKIYSMNILDTCEKDAILFTSGDNDTFPLWCVQEVFDYRKDVRVVNLSLFNTDWYVYQMKWQYDVPMSLTRDQIEWNEYKTGDRVIRRPAKPFIDRPRKRRTYLVPMYYSEEGRVVKLQDMMVDEVFLENKGRYPIYFSSEPYAESPLNLRNLTVSCGVLYKLDSTQRVRPIDSERGYDLYKNVYRYDGLDDPNIYRDENATGVMLGLGFNAVRIADDSYRSGDTARAMDILEFIIEKYPEFLQAYSLLAKYYRDAGDSAQAEALLDKAEENLLVLIEKDDESQFYLSDYGLLLHDRGRTEEALPYLWKAFEINKNSGHVFHKLTQVLYEAGRGTDLINATKMHADYKVNRNDQMVQQILRIAPPTGVVPDGY